MPLPSSDNDFSPRTGDIVTIGIDLPDMTFAEAMATVVGSDGEEISLELGGEGFSPQPQLSVGLKVLISKGEGQTLYQGVSRLKRLETARIVIIDPPKRVVVRERREYMRMDVTVPVKYSLPQSQNMADVIAEWERSKECNSGCPEGEALLAGRKQLVNLSGSGLCFTMGDCFPPGTLLHVKIALPGEKPDHVKLVGAIVRTKKLSPENSPGALHSTALSFRMITGSDRQKLVRHILNEQRKNLMLPTPPYLRSQVVSA